MKKIKRLPLLFVAFALVSAMALAGCGDKREDTRKHVDTIGVVFTNDIDTVFHELYVYPGDISDMGEDFIKNTGGIIKVGSYGVTVEVSPSYSVWLKDKNGGSYEFERVTLMNADVAVISYDKSLTLTVNHRDGSAEEVEGRYVPPGDAPDHSQVPLKKRVSYKFTLENDTGDALRLVSMREAADQYKGEVELHIQTLDDGQTVTIDGKLGEEDTKVTEWVLHVKTMEGNSYTSTESFDPWETEEVVLSIDAGELVLDAK